MDVDYLAKKIWDYLNLDHKLEKADCILVLGANDLRVPERGAQLFLEKWAPLLIFTGGRGRLTPPDWKTEAEKFAQVAIARGVPQDKIIIENKSTNTQENIEFTKNLLAHKGINPDKIILVHQPYMLRRALAVIDKHWTGKKVITTTLQYSYENYATEYLTKDTIINLMVGEIQRLKLYSEKEYITHQDIPQDIWQAFEELVKLGYTKCFVK